MKMSCTCSAVSGIESTFVDRSPSRGGLGFLSSPTGVLILSTYSSVCGGIVMSVRCRLQQVQVPNFSSEDIIISQTILEYIIQFTQNEQGVRNLKRCLETIYTKLNLFRLMEKNTFVLGDTSINYEGKLNLMIVMMANFETVFERAPQKPPTARSTKSVT